MSIKKICVLGGSGFVGRHIVHRLAAQGYEVRVLTRRRERSKGLIVLPTVDVVEANVFDPFELDRHFDGMDAVINLVGILHEKTASRVDKPLARRGDFQAAHIELLRKVLHACAAAGIKRLLHMSALGADPTGQSAYQRSKGIGEVLLREAGSPHSEHENWYLNGPKFVRGQGLAVTIFRPSVIFGPEDSFLNLFAGLVKRLPLLPLANPGARFQPIYVEDVAHAFVSSLADPTTFGETYELCGPKAYTLLELVTYVSSLTGHRRPIVPLGDWLSYVQSLLLEFAPGKLMTRDNYYSMKADNVCACPFPPVFGIQPTALEAVAPGYLARR
jgi:NADH dehydrogenase